MDGWIPGVISGHDWSQAGEHSPLEPLLGQAIAINRYSQLACQARQSVDMIAMFVGDEDACQTFRSPPNLAEPFPCLAGTKTRIHQDPCFPGFDVGAIT